MYKTELMQEILTSKKAQEIVQMISPLYGEAYVALWILQAAGVIQDQMAEWCESLADQTRPSTATWSLPYWEKQYNVVPDPSWDIERRRQNITNKMRQRAPMNPEKLAAIIAVAAGANCAIEENTGKNHFTVHLSGISKLDNEAHVRSVISKAKPAHLIYDIVITETITCEVQTYTGVAMTGFISETIPVLATIGSGNDSPQMGTFMLDVSRLA